MIRWFRVFLVVLWSVAAATSAAGQAMPGRPHRMGVPTAPSRLPGPAVYRNQPATPPQPAVVAPPLSRQDRQAYENCPDPRRFGPKTRPKKLVRIW